jgi:type VI secretion system protein ImpH
MSTPKRRRIPGVIQQLLDEPYRFEFFQAIRLLERWYAQNNPSMRPGDVLPSRLRFRNSLNLSFPPSEIAQLGGVDKAGVRLRIPYDLSTPNDDASPSSHIDLPEKIEITPAFFGLLGSQGVLPLNYTETIAGREYVDRDFAAREFLDIFTNRATAFFYSAWKKYRLPFRAEPDRSSHYMPQLLSLAGLGNDALRNRLSGKKPALPDPTNTKPVTDTVAEVFDESLAFYASAVGHQPMSTVYLQQVLSDYFKINIVLEQFIGKWFTLPAEHRTALGGFNAKLGATTLAGARAWQRHLRVRIWIGALNKNEFTAFLPSGKKARSLEALLNLLAGVTLEYEVRLILRKEDVAPTVLGNGNQLGFSTFLNTRPEQHDRDDARYELQALH